MLFKKFCVYFKEDYVEEDQQKIIQYFKEWRIMNEKDSVLALIDDRKFMNSLRDGVAQKWVISFLEVFDENKQLFKKNPGLADEFEVTI
jgi:hypothetical protein